MNLTSPQTRLAHIHDNIKDEATIFFTIPVVDTITVTETTTLATVTGYTTLPLSLSQLFCPNAPAGPVATPSIVVVVPIQLGSLAQASAQATSLIPTPASPSDGGLSGGWIAALTVGMIVLSILVFVFVCWMQGCCQLCRRTQGRFVHSDSDW
jgi:hypothetical protein